MAVDHQRVDLAAADGAQGVLVFGDLALQFADPFGQGRCLACGRFLACVLYGLCCRLPYWKL